MSLHRAAAQAFAGRLDAAARTLDVTARSLPPDDRASVSWLRAYLAAAVGDFAAAERLARGLLRARATSEETRARAAVTLGSVLRQTHRHAAALQIERAALRGAPREVRIHLLIGLAADAVGLGRLGEVDAALRRIGRPASADWRAHVRLRWVRCERELLAGRPAEAVRHARAALSLSRRHRARRHEAKSHLFLGAALREAATRIGPRPPLERDARRSLRSARTLAARIGARPIADVAGSLLGGSGARG